MENIRSCNQHKGRIHTKEGEGIPIVKRRKRRGVQVHPRTTKEKVH